MFLDVIEELRQVWTVCACDTQGFGQVGLMFLDMFSAVLLHCKKKDNLICFVDGFGFI